MTDNEKSPRGGLVGLNLTQISGIIHAVVEPEPLSIAFKATSERLS